MAPLLQIALQHGACLTTSVRSCEAAGFDMYCMARQLHGLSWPGTAIVRDAMIIRGGAAAAQLEEDESAFSFAAAIKELRCLMNADTEVAVQAAGLGRETPEAAALQTEVVVCGLLVRHSIEQAAVIAATAAATAASSVPTAASKPEARVHYLAQLVAEGNPLLHAHVHLSSHFLPILGATFDSYPTSYSTRKHDLHGSAQLESSQLRVLRAGERRQLALLGLLTCASSLEGGGEPRLEPACNHAAGSGVLASPIFERLLQPFFGHLHTAFAFAVPTDAALEAVAACGPVCELGAGSGYWAAQLARRGVDVLAYDLEPPALWQSNHFFTRAFFDVRRGGPEVLAGLAEVESATTSRALLLVWPFHLPLHEAQLAEGGDPEPWDSRALRCFRGSTIIHVGELPNTGGVELNTSSRFAEQLQLGFELMQTIELPRAPFCRDSLTVWHRCVPVG